MATVYVSIRHSGQVLLFILLGASRLLLITLVQKIKADISKQQKSEQRFKALLDAAPDATVIVNDKGLIELINLQTELLFCYNRSELLGKPVEILIPGNLRKVHALHVSSFVKEPRVRSMGVGLELEAIKKDGTKFPVEISLSPLQTVEGLLVSASIRDITQRKKSEQKFKALLDAAPDATVIVNEKGTIEMINHQTENLFGY